MTLPLYGLILKWGVSVVFIAKTCTCICVKTGRDSRAISRQRAQSCELFHPGCANMIATLLANAFLQGTKPIRTRRVCLRHVHEQSHV